MDFDDEDAPPELVHKNGSAPVDAPDNLQSEMEELSIVKVPITIVTGMIDSKSLPEQSILKALYSSAGSLHSPSSLINLFS